MKTADVRKLTPYERLVYWVREREAVRLRKESGAPPPWTDDEIIQSYRFCNCRRMDDKVSRWLMDNWYVPFRDHPNSLYAAALARFFNLPSTLGAVTDLVYRDGAPAWAAARDRAQALRKNGTIFNSAYMVRGDKPGGDKVREVIYDYVKPLSRKPGVAVDTTSMERTHAAVSARHGFGSFTAGQVVADLRWALTGTWADRHDWAPMGPGSKKGLNRTFGLHPDSPLDQEKFLRGLRDVRNRLVRDLPPSITSRLEMMDYQNCLCEITGYANVLLGEGRKKQRYPGRAQNPIEAGRTESQGEG